jgi:hypothetical protein
MLKSSIDLDAIRARYSRALDVQPSKGKVSDEGVAVLKECACDVHDLIAEVERLLSLEGALCEETIPGLVAVINRLHDWNAAERRV